jgi:hypothetical protein
MLYIFLATIAVTDSEPPILHDPPCQNRPAPRRQWETSLPFAFQVQNAVSPEQHGRPDVIVFAVPRAQPSSLLQNQPRAIDLQTADCP